MNLSQLRYFVKLAHEKHYTKAAEQLCITQPSLSHAISTLEKELGVQLFEKKSRNTELTCCGRQFLTVAENTLNVLDNGIQMLSRVAKGEGLIRVGFLRTLGIEYIPDIISHYRAAHLSDNVEFTFEVDLSPQLLQDLLAHKLDVVFASKPAADTAFHCIAIEKQDLVLIVPKNHPLAGRSTIDLKDTADYPYIVFNKKSGLRLIVDTMLEKAGVTPRIAYEISEDEVIGGMVAKNFGIAVVPFMNLLLQLDVKILPISHPQYERKFYMITNKQIYLPPVVQHFCDFVIAHSKID